MMSSLKLSNMINSLLNIPNMRRLFNRLQVRFQLTDLPLIVMIMSPPLNTLLQLTQLLHPPTQRSGNSLVTLGNDGLWQIQLQPQLQLVIINRLSYLGEGAQAAAGRRIVARQLEEGSRMDRQATYMAHIRDVSNTRK